MADTVRHPLQQLCPKQYFDLRGVTLTRFNARLIRDWPHSSRFNSQYGRREEKALYRYRANMAVKNYLAGNIDDVVIGKQVHGYLD